MNKRQFMDYIAENYNIAGEAFRLIGNILDFVSVHGVGESEQHLMLCSLLEGTIGLSEQEIKRISL